MQANPSPIKMNYYEHHLGDYARDTMHLSALEHGIYRLLLDRYYATEQPIPEEQAHRYARAEPKDVLPILQEFFVPSANGWTHKRADRVIAAYHAKQEAAKRSADARWNKRDGNANAMRTHTERNANHKPVTSNQSKEESKPLSLALPDWLDLQVWQQFVLHRGKKFTGRSQELALKHLSEFKAEGHDPNRIMETSIANGWKGLFPPKGTKNVTSRDDSRKRTIKALTGYDADAIQGTATRTY